MGILKKISEKIEMNKVLKDIEHSAYNEEKIKVDVENKDKAKKEAIKRGKAKARGDKKNSKSDFSKKLNAWADRKAAEMKEMQGKEGEFKIPDGYNNKW